jgi:DNA modification methylase
MPEPSKANRKAEATARWKIDCILDNLKLGGFRTTLVASGSTRHVLVTGDCIDVMKALPVACIDLIVTDPPYNINLDYGGFFKDNMKKDAYLKWCSLWLEQCARVLGEKGTMYLISYPEINAYLVPYLDNTLKFRRWLTWHYPTNIGHSKSNFTRSQRSILFYTKSDSYIFNRENLIQHYKNPKVGKIKERIKRGSKGRASYDLLRVLDLVELQKGMIDVLDFNLLKNTSRDRQRGHPCQLPLGLLGLLVKASTNRNHIVLDPFAGTFGTSLAAIRSERNSVGIEINPDFVRLGSKRLRR